MHNKEPEHFGELLKEMRKSYGISQETMSEMLGMTPRNYRRVENGELKITPEKFYRLAKVFEKTLLRETGFVLDERYSASDLVSKAVKIFERLFKVGGGKP